MMKAREEPQPLRATLLPTLPSKTNGKSAGKFRKGAQLRKAESALQGTAMLIKRIEEGKTQAELAQLFHCNPSAVAKRIASALTPDLQQLARDVVTERLIPKAVGVLERELDKGNYAAAKDVLNGLQVFQTGGKATIEHVTNSPTLDAIRRERQRLIEGEVLPTVEEVKPPPVEDPHGTG